MSRYRIVKKILVVLCCTVAFLFLSGVALVYSKFNVMPYDAAWFLSDKTETIDVFKINWACDCADYTYYRTPPADLDAIPEEGFFFVEAADPSLTIRDNRNYSSDTTYAYNYVRLTGRFYTDQGISRTYELKTPEKPKPARVFLYDKIEYRLD
jgi:hypothetical protein